MRLKEGLARHQSEPGDEQLRDGLIQRFEFTYELCHRVLRRGAASPEGVDRMEFRDLIRKANQQGLLLGDWPAWHRYRDMRARTSHTYQAANAEEVARAIPAFLAEAEDLRDQLRAPGMTVAIDLPETDTAIVRDILRHHLPPGCLAFVFGSRATGSVRRYSDLDLAP